jgi:catechol 2,3-dioxygenase-like lactoylglutathione lyase family enzyme
MTTRAHFILYVADQNKAREFYAAVLQRAPTLDVPGMTEIRLASGAVLGLMPAAGIERLLGARLPEGAGRERSARGELYLVVDDAAAHHARALDAGARELSPLSPRDWGHRVAYGLDLDGYVLAFDEE